MFTSCCRSDLLVPRFDPETACGVRARTTTGPVSAPAVETTIGRVIFRTHRGERAEAILDVEGRCRCPKLPVLDRVLNALYAPGRGGASDMPFGYSELIRVAAWLKGEVRSRRSPS